MTELLGQQELMEPGPTRRLQVAADHTAIWGVDPSVKRCAIRSVCPEWSWVETVHFGDMEGAPRLDDIYRELSEFARLACIATRLAGKPVPGLIHVEQPSGSERNLPLEYAVGITMAALFRGVLDATMERVKVELVSSAHWKKVACGKGNIYKPTKKALGRTPVDIDYGVLRWARANGYEGSSWDEADAWGIAEAARREIALVPR